MRARNQVPRLTRAVLAGLAALAAVLAGCGTARGPARPHPAALARGQSHPWPPGGSPALARSVGRRLLAGLVLPPGSRRAAEHHDMRPAEVIGSKNLVDLHEFFVLPMSMQAAASFFNLHPPAGLRAEGTGFFSAQNGAPVQDVTFSLRVIPAGIAGDTFLLVSLSGGPDGTTLARADAEVVWYPPRTAAEYLRPAAIRSARVTAILTNPGTRHLTKVVRSRHAIARLAALLNGMRAAQHGDWSCPSLTSSYRVTFTSHDGRTRVRVEAAGCPADVVTVNGEAQPALWDPQWHLIRALRSLLGLSPRLR